MAFVQRHQDAAAARPTTETYFLVERAPQSGDRGEPDGRLVSGFDGRLVSGFADENVQTGTLAVLIPVKSLPVLWPILLNEEVIGI